MSAPQTRRSLRGMRMAVGVRVAFIADCGVSRAVTKLCRYGLLVPRPRISPRLVWRWFGGLYIVLGVVRVVGYFMDRHPRTPDLIIGICWLLMGVAALVLAVTTARSAARRRAQ